jgi:dipeptidyl aminopeptidase/acylaminoacyl peptidase
MSEPQLIPRRVLFGNPERVSPQLSPDGEQLAFIAPHNDVLNVWLASPSGEHARVLTNDQDRGIRQFTWAHDRKHLIYMQDAGGDENWHVYVVEITTGATKDITPFDSVQARLVEIDKHFPNTIVLAINKDNPQLHDLYRYELDTETLTKVEENPGFLSWQVDKNFVARGAATMTPEGGAQLFYRANVDEEWKPIYEVDHEDSMAFGVLAFGENDDEMYITSSRGANAAELLILNAATSDTTRIAGDKNYDVAGVHINADTRRAQLVAFRKARMEYQVLDDSIAQDWENVRTLYDGDPFIENVTDDEMQWIIAFTSDIEGVVYFRYDRNSKKGTKLFSARPDLEKFSLAPMEPFKFKARDGLEVHGYLTFPPDSNRKNLPTVLNVHGGPWARDDWGYDGEAQWMANRGYLCVQVNYRGSTGYGKNFVNAGDHEWGGKMHDDLLDAIDYLIAEGTSDPEKIAIYGGSYGGYAALVGATFTPERFCCAVDIVGPSNLKTLIESIPPYWAPLKSQFDKRVGDLSTEPDFLWERSPLSRVENVSIPLLIAQGANDPRVKQAEAEQIVAALKEKGIPYEYELYADEGHGFAKPENRMDFYAKAEGFLAEHLGGRSEN